MPYRFGFGDDVADGQDQAVVANHGAVADPLGAENRRGERVLRDLGADQDHRAQRRIEIELDRVCLRLQVKGKGPLGRFGHDFGLSTQYAGAGAPKRYSRSLRQPGWYDIEPDRKLHRVWPRIERADDTVTRAAYFRAIHA